MGQNAMCGSCVQLKSSHVARCREQKQKFNLNSPLEAPKRCRGLGKQPVVSKQIVSSRKGPVQVSTASPEHRAKWDVTAFDEQGPRERSFIVREFCGACSS